MATLILGAAGRALAGPVGGLLGSLAGGFVDRALFGPGRRDVGRIDNPQVQSSAYGEALPVVIGRMRVAGNLIWCSGIAEHVSRTGGGKSGQATNQYNYTASFAVGLSARAINEIGRIWADGRLVRDRDGTYLLPMTMRLHQGGEDQPVDPLIAAAEGIGQTPAYRGLAYVVFEDLPLEDFGNRIPSLSFEVIADEGALDFGVALRELCRAARLPLTGVSIDTAGEFAPLSGYIFGRPGSVADALAPVLEVCDAAVMAEAGGLRILGMQPATADQIRTLPEADGQARQATQAATRDRRIHAGDSGPYAMELGYYDEERDYQAGLQRACRGGARQLRQEVVPAAMQPGQAKGLATALLMRHQAERWRRTVSLPWRALGVRPGMLVRMGGADVWRVRELRFEGFVLTLSLQRVSVAMSVMRAGDGGRSLRFRDQVAGSTRLHFMELPALGGSLPTVPALMVAGAGASQGWRRGSFEISSDMGASYTTGGVLESGTTMGTVATPLASGPQDIWDRHNYFDVELLGPHMWIEGRSEAAVLQGSNLALVGDELLQFRDVEVLAPGRFRVRTLLRGQRGTEHAVDRHGVNERFVLLDGSGLVVLQSSLESIGQQMMVRPMGAADLDTPPVSLTVRGEALLPLAPAHLRLFKEDGDVLIDWIRRSRAGFAWLDFVDAPLGEATEAYRLDLYLDGRHARTVEVKLPGYRYRQEAIAEDGGGAVLAVELMQLSAAIGPGRAARGSILLT
jgi:hypothetical protein